MAPIRKKKSKKKAHSQGPMWLAIAGVLLLAGLAAGGAYVAMSPGEAPVEGEVALVSPVSPVEAPAAAPAGAAAPVAEPVSAAPVPETRPTEPPRPVSLGPWLGAADPPAEPIEWGDPSRVAVPIGGDSTKCVLPRQISPYVGVIGVDRVQNRHGIAVVDLRTGRPLLQQRPTGWERFREDDRLSADGRWLLTKRDNLHALVSLESGQYTHRFEVGSEFHYLDFAPPRLILAQPVLTQDQIWRLKMREAPVWCATYPPVKKVREYPLKGVDVVMREGVDVSPGGRYLATVGINHPQRLFEVATGKEIAVWSFKAAKTSRSSLRFRPDGAELALFTASPTEFRLAVIDMRTGAVAEDFTWAPVEPGWFETHSNPRHVDWLPDGRGWLIGGRYVVERRTKKIVWTFSSQYGDHSSRCLIPAESGVFFVVREPIRQQILEREQLMMRWLPIPWDRIDASLAAMDADAPSLVGPGRTVSLDIEPTVVRVGTLEAARDALTAAATQSLKEHEIAVAPGQPVVLVIRYAEEPGTMRNQMEMAWKSVDDDKTLWSNVVDQTGAMSRPGDPPAEVSAKIASFLRRANLPYFLPESSDLNPLPGITNVGFSSFRRPGFNATPQAPSPPPRAAF